MMLVHMYFITANVSCCLPLIGIIYLLFYLGKRSSRLLTQTLSPRMSWILHPQWSWGTMITPWLGTSSQYVIHISLLVTSTYFIWQLILALIEQAYNHFFVYASGYLTAIKHDVQSHSLTFDLAPEQYTNMHKDYNKNWKPVQRRHHSHSIVSSKNLLDGPQCWNCKLGISSQFLGFSHVFVNRRERFTFLRSMLNKSISWGRQPYLLLLINLQKPVHMSVHSLSISD